MATTTPTTTNLTLSTGAILVSSAAYGLFAVFALLNLYGQPPAITVLGYTIVAAVGLAIHLLWSLWSITLKQQFASRSVGHFVVGGLITWGVAFFAFLALGFATGFGYQDSYSDAYVSAGDLFNHFRQVAGLPSDSDALAATKYDAWRAANPTAAGWDLAQFSSAQALSHASRNVWFAVNVILWLTMFVVHLSLALQHFGTVKRLEAWARVPERR